MEDQTIKNLAVSLGLQTDLARSLLPVVIENLQLLDRKQQDYGAANLLKFGVDGVVVRASDKLERIINLRARMKQVKDAEAPQVALNESLSDSLLDLANYALIAYVMQTGKWPTDRRALFTTNLPAPVKLDGHGGIAT